MRNQTPNAEVVFCAAVEIVSAEERDAYVERACGDDEKLKDRVRELLDAHFRSDSFLERPAPGLETTGGITPITESPGTVVDRYKLLEQIGEGGMGVVYMAEQLEPVQRRVALKIIKPGMDTKQVIARFEAERQALALMDHPNIARVLDAGATESGRPYFVMELVKGIPITEYCDKKGLSTDERLNLLSRVCQAVQHAHQKGIIHRDLKPSNVMVTLRDGKPVAKVIDFGVAKAISQRLTERTLFTGYGQMVGTPQYMSPEQAEMSELDVDTRSDVYSLGVMLYELLTGSTPLDADRLRGAGYAEIQRIIHEEDPPKPSLRLSLTDEHLLTAIATHRNTEPHQLQQRIRGELDWIAMRALEKERDRRYESPKALAADIERLLHNEPVEACPPSKIYRLRKFVHRNRLLAVSVLAVSLALLLGVTGIVIGFVRAKQHAAAEKRAREDLQSALYAHDMHEAFALWDDGDIDGMVKILRTHECVRGEDGRPGFEVRLLLERLQQIQKAELLLQCSSMVSDLAFSAADNRILATLHDGTVMLYNANTKKARLLPDRSQHDPRHKILRACFCRGSEGVVAVDVAPKGNAALKTWDLESDSVETVPLGGDRTADRWTFSPDGSLLAAATEDRVLVWQTGASEPKHVYQTPMLLHHTIRPVRAISFSSDNRVLAIATGRREFSVWKLESGENWSTMTKHDPSIGIFDLVLSADGRLLATGGHEEVIVWELRGQGARMLRTIRTAVRCLRFSPDSRVLATGHPCGYLQLWDVATGRSVGELPHPPAVACLSFSSDGSQVITGSNDGIVRRWTLDQAGPPVRFWGVPGGYFVGVAVSPDGANMGMGDSSGGIVIWDLSTGKSRRLARQGKDRVHCLAIDPGGKILASASRESNAVELWEVETGRLLKTLSDHAGVVCSVDFSPCGKWVAAGGQFGELRIWDSTTYEPIEVGIAIPSLLRRYRNSGRHVSHGWLIHGRYN